MTTIEKDKETLVETKKRFENGDMDNIAYDLEWLIETLGVYICRYERLQKAASESVGNAHITNTRLKVVQGNNNDK